MALLTYTNELFCTVHSTQRNHRPNSAKPASTQQIETPLRGRSGTPPDLLRWVADISSPSVSLPPASQSYNTDSDAPAFSSIVESGAIHRVLSYLNEGELIHSATLVSTMFADVAAEALGDMMKKLWCAESETSTFGPSSLASSKTKTWEYLMGRFPSAEWIGDGGYKQVYKVRNGDCEGFDAISVM